MAGQAAVSFDGRVRRPASISLGAAATVFADAVKTSEFAARLDAVATINAQAMVRKVGAASLAGQASLVASTTERMVAAAHLASAGSSLTAAFRLTYAIAGLYGSGYATVAGDRVTRGQAAMAALAQVRTKEGVRSPQSVALNAAATIEGRADRRTNGAASLFSGGASIGAAATTIRLSFAARAVGMMQAAAFYRRAGNFAGIAKALMQAGAKRLASGSASLSAFGTIAARAGYTRQGAASLGAYTAVRITQGGARRVTEDGSPRAFTGNPTSFFTAHAELIPSFENVSIFYGGTWIDTAETYVNIDGEWIQVIKIYAKQNGVWKLTR